MVPTRAGSAPQLTFTIGETTMTMTSLFASQAPAWGAPAAAPPEFTVLEPAEQPTQQLRDQTIAQSTDPGTSAYALLPMAAKVALLSAAKDGLLVILAREKAKLINLNADSAEPVQARSVFGTVNYQPAKEQHNVDEDALLEHVKADPELAQHIQTVQIVPDWVKSMLIESATHRDDGAYTLKDGTVVDYMSPGSPKAAQVTYPASKQQKVTKQAAEQALQSVLDTLATEVASATRQDN